MRHLCTYFDINFLPRGLALLDSINRYSSDYTLYILALDEEVFEYIEVLNHPNVKIISLDVYIKYFNIDKSKYKTEKEFYFSIKPSLCIYLMQNFINIDTLVYIDADMYFFNDIELLYNEINEASIAMCYQHLPWYLSKKYGIYNAGFVSFKNDNEGNKCLTQWYKDCSSWDCTSESNELSFFSDQIWLSKWPKLYKNVKVIMHKGINTAPWNANQYHFQRKDTFYYVDSVPLILYHFSSIKQLKRGRWHVNTIFTILNVNGILKMLYIEYLKNVEEYITEKRITNQELKISGNRIKKFVAFFFTRIHKHIVEF